MESKNLNINRVIFLKKFTEEIIINLSKDHETEKKIRIEKLKKKFNIKEDENTTSMDDAFKKILNHKILESPRYAPPSNIPNQNNKPIEKPLISKKHLFKPFNRKVPQKIHPLHFNLPKNKKPINETLAITPYVKTADSDTIKPEYSEKPKGFYLDKIEELIKDPFVQAVECLGPGKNLLVKKNNRINLTKIVLSQDEISKIIETFSKESKIPSVRGILKTAVGDLIISAIESENVGSRFIITRINPMESI